jgi:membrane protein implicated in regulation of membrane protease activity
MAQGQIQLEVCFYTALSLDYILHIWKIVKKKKSKNKNQKAEKNKGQ